jgi:hypothetical protein
VALSPFPSAPPCALRALDVRVARPAPDRLALEYELQGDLSALRIASGGDRDRPTEGLWRHTCMEVFVAREAAGAYLEFNLAPSGQWAAYRFSGYRAGMTPLTGIDPPRIELRTQSDRLLLCAEVRLPPDQATGPLRLGLTAVIESTPGPLSYWALRHPAERPDFHHADSFGFEI